MTVGVRFVSEGWRLEGGLVEVSEDMREGKKRMRTTDFSVLRGGRE